MPLDERSKYHVPAAAKTLQILETLAHAKEPVSLQYLTEQTGLPKSSVFAILSTLETLRYVERDASSLFALGLKALQLGAAATQTTNLSQLFHDVARKTVKECGETVQLSILEQTEVIYVAAKTVPNRSSWHPTLVDVCPRMRPRQARRYWRRCPKGLSMRSSPDDPSHH